MLDVYANSPEFAAIQQGLQVGLDALWEAVEDTKKQIFVATADSGLNEWEQCLGIAGGAMLTHGQRRETVNARQRGGSTFTKSVIQGISDAYNGGPVEVTTDYPNFSITITFTGIYGVPEQFDALQTEIERQIPAHMTAGYSYKWVTHDQLQLSALTHDELSEYTHEETKAAVPLGG